MILKAKQTKTSQETKNKSQIPQCDEEYLLKCTTKVTLNGELCTLSYKLEKKSRILNLTTSIQHDTRDSSYFNKAKKNIKA